MPIISGLKTAQIRDVNTMLATTFFPRFQKTQFSKLCGSTLSTALVEPFAFDGASPLLRKFNGSVSSGNVNSFSLQVPNPIYKNREDISRTMYEMDQTGTIRKRSGAIGIRVAQGPDFKLARTLLKGDADTTVVFEGTTYNVTFDGVAQFSASHVLGGLTQSNLITGNLGATTMAGLEALDVAAVVQQLWKDYTTIVDTITRLKDDKGVALFPDFDPEQSLQLICHSGLKPYFDLAFTAGGMVGGSPGNSGSTGSTEVKKKLVAEIVSMGLLRGCIDIDSESGATVSPTFETQYYWAIKDDFVRPWYFQRFRPKKGSDFVPDNYDPEAVADAALRAANLFGEKAPKVTPEAADMYAMTSIDTNVGAIGNNAQQSVVDGEAFFMSGRTRFNIFNGPWFLCGKVDPAGQST